MSTDTHTHREEPCSCEPPEEIVALHSRIAELEAECKAGASMTAKLTDRCRELEEKLATLQQTYQEFQATYGLTLETDNPDKPGTLGFLLAENAALQRALQDAADRFNHFQKEFMRMNMPVGAALAGVYEQNARNLLAQRRKA